MKRALDLLAEYVIRGRTKISGPHDIDYIDQPDDWRVQFAVTGGTSAIAGDFIYINSSKNHGFHEIVRISGEGTDAPAARFLTGTETTGPVGTLGLYKWDTYQIGENYQNYLRWIEKDLGISPDGATVTELHSGNGKRKLMLDRPDVQSVAVQTDSGTLSPEIIPGGFLLLPNGQTFPRGKDNLEVTLTTAPNVDAEIAAALLTAADALGGDAGATGGGSLSVISWSRSYGDRGKFSGTRNDFAQNASRILSRYAGKVVGR